MAKICNLFSGSSGNCTYLSAGEDAILVDVGVSCKQILSAMQERNFLMSNIRGVFLTHAHSDHVKGLRVLLKKCKIPVYASKETLGALLSEGILSPQDTYVDIADASVDSLPFRAEHFQTSHDCAGSVGYIFSFPEGEKVAICTDLGVMTEEIRTKLTGCQTVMLESNHDVGMLQNGPYPFVTKQRILSDEGHLSNGSCAEELPRLVRQGTTRIILAHLSRDNNTPDLARVTAESVLLENGFRIDSDYWLYIAPKCGGKIIYL